MKYVCLEEDCKGLFWDLQDRNEVTTPKHDTSFSKT